MALFKTIAEVKVFWPMLSSSKIENILPFIKQAERKFIIPAISQAEYDALNTWYNAGTPPAESATKSALLLNVQAALALYAKYLWIPSGQLQEGDSGIRIATTDTLKTAFQWQIDELQRSVIEQAGNAMDDLLAFMEANKGDYALWSASSAYTLFKDCFIPSAAKFTEIYNGLGGSRLNFMAIRGQMVKIQDFVIQSELSQTFYDELKAQLKANTLSANNAKLIPMIQNVVANLTMSSAFTQLSVKIGEDGVVNFNTTASRVVSRQNEPAKNQQITKLETQAEKDGRAYLVILKEYLKANIANYPTYASSDAYDSEESTDNSFKNDPNQKGWAAMM